MCPPRNAETPDEALATALDALMNRVMSETEPWDAYDAAMDVVGLLSELLTDDNSPYDVGAICKVCAETTDLYAAGKAPVEVAHNVLREAAGRWVNRSQQPGRAFFASWLKETGDSVSFVIDRYGDFWSQGSEGACEQAGAPNRVD